MDFTPIEAMLRAVDGTATMFYKNLTTGEEWQWRSDEPVNAASVIKIPVMIEAFAQMAEGKLNAQERFALRDADRLPSCGALKTLHEGIELTAMDLVKLMIILSDNTATNMLVKRVGLEAVNARLEALGLEKTRMRRLLFDRAASAKGLRNTITAREIGELLERMYRGEIVGAAACEAMLEILKDQRLNGKMPFVLHAQGIACAHKTGEDATVTHDCGIVYAGEPFVLCFCSEGVDVAAFERVMQDATRLLAGV